MKTMAFGTFFAYFCLTMYCSAEPAIIPAPDILSVPPIATLPSKGEYVSALSKVEIAIDEIVDVKKYAKQEVELEGKKVVFEKLTPFQQDMILIVQAHQFYKELSDLYIRWILCKIETLLTKDLPKEVPSTKEMEEFVKKLQTLRKEHATNHEDFAVRIAEKHKNRIPQADAEYYLSQLKELHDKEGLVKRDE